MELKNSRKRFLLGAAVLISCVALAIFVPLYRSLHRSPLNHPLYRQREEAGILTAKDHFRLNNIQLGIEKNRTVSDEDLDWAIRLMHSEPMRNSEKARYELPRVVMAYLGGPKRLSTSQRDKLFQAVLPYLSSPNKWLRMAGITSMININDPRAISHLRRLTNDPDGDVKRLAVKVLNRISKTNATLKAGMNSSV